MTLGWFVKLLVSLSLFNKMLVPHKHLVVSGEHLVF